MGNFHEDNIHFIIEILERNGYECLYIADGKAYPRRVSYPDLVMKKDGKTIRIEYESLGNMETKCEKRRTEMWNNTDCFDKFIVVIPDLRKVCDELWLFNNSTNKITIIPTRAKPKGEIIEKEEEFQEEEE